MGRVARARTGLVTLVLGAALVAACSHGPKKAEGRWHVVRRGDTLWSIAQRYETSVEAIDRANEGLDPHALRVGRKLWIPPGGVGSGRSALGGSATRTLERRDHDDRACGELARKEDLGFEWPVLGHLTSRFGDERGRRGHDGIDLVADEGTPIRAAEAGRVVYAGDELGDYGKVVIVKHAGRWATVYAHNRKNLVDEGTFVEKGDVIAEVGDTGNASAPHLHFEVRRGNAPRDPESCLP
jgi:murein DD-endopeptidase MepM/ murein hydrolase activator NlpD